MSSSKACNIGDVSSFDGYQKVIVNFTACFLHKTKATYRIGLITIVFELNDCLDFLRNVLTRTHDYKYLQSCFVCLYLVVIYIYMRSQI